MLSILSVCSVDSVVNDTLINLKSIGQVSPVFFDMICNLPDLGHNLFNIQVENISISNPDTSIHHDVAHVRALGRIDDMRLRVING